ncbi:MULTISPECIES: SseB family protein [unclassified Cryobacterium]|uniref:SseB family protein n=1 Tax=unclassified Cryobacterium TaxID=2649013 RepID=UPI00106A3163|nr:MULTISPECIES: SseB family protein [unclassified Cryobacterium]TFC54914.1 SseB family protein [Cryobacterium sp. TMB3-1-2]TFC62516.1 SseB family protein [Cryobacterium sp. TMB1-7]TFC70405.1 SseB family protein [Cryobacterium sp. TMB3-15]TFC75746.1 SseB family protein [Cryobacterium sp. TMB3-10]TFD45516.1 SseB family protein [Cryobacterium sp. TMB3-12]
MSPARNLGSTGRPDPVGGSAGGAAGDTSADSAGQPWANRSLEDTAFADDDGLAPPALLRALRRFQARETGEEDVVDAFRSARLLIPLVTALGADEAGTVSDGAAGPHGLRVDKTQELSIITVAGPDGRAVLPVFSSAAAMHQWNAQARPVPADAVRVALAAAQESTDLVVLDPTADTEFAVRRPALWAIAQGAPWTPSYASRSVAVAFEESIATELSVLSVSLTAGDPQSRLAGPELIVRLELVDGLSRALLDATLARLAARWAANDVIATGVDSLRVQLVASA